MAELALEDITLELIRAVVVLGLFVWLLIYGRRHQHVRGWRWIMTGFGLLCFASLIDITDNFDALNVYVVIGDTEIESFLEKVVGYLAGFICLSVGFYIWLPAVHAHQQHLERELNVLTGLLPICASCKKICDDQGRWQPIESYISEHSEAEFSHSMCSVCYQHFYGKQPSKT